MDELPLSLRKKSLLYSAIDNYIKMSSPITSLLVQKTELHDLSTATIRNELNALEQMGYLKQLHTSSGRVPTTKGYRFFVNETLKNVDASGFDIEDIRKKLFDRTMSLTQIVDGISKVVSSKTNYPTVFMFDGFENLIIKNIQVVYLVTNKVLVLIETNIGAISNTLPASSFVTKKDCDNATNVFTSVFSGRTIGYLTDNVGEVNFAVKSAMSEYEEIFKLVLEVINVYKNTRSKVENKGIIKLLENKDLKNVESAKNILSVLDDVDTLKDVLDTDKEGVSVNIGEENIKELSDCAVFKAPLVLDGKKIGTLGVIGPEKIDYASIASVLKFVADEIKGNTK